MARPPSVSHQLRFLRNLKAKELTTIARAIGANTTGIKPSLIANIETQLSPSDDTLTGSAKKTYEKSRQQRKNDYSIISIDMGIRNLAYCHLKLPPTWLQSTKETVKPVLTHWDRIDVFESKDSDNEKALESDIAKEEDKHSFSPSLYAAHAYTLLTHTILPLQPTHILIERQRFRSLGASAVQEWTLRVNMFEAMLYATLCTLTSSRIWEGEVIPVLPSKVASYWIAKKGTKKAESSKTKKLKVGIVRDMLENKQGFEVHGDQALTTVDLFTKKSRIRGPSSVRNEAQSVGQEKRPGMKFDDLADCVLQGLAWAKWEENKRLVKEKGARVLDLWAEDKKPGKAQRD
ncbi:MAG: hypothetical protein Q9220_004009 [cf. Caloplaca sp. 1 TL-2023]